ncbi:GyrI-like domain-containing protein [Desulfovibrio litoralis]|uniref:GyrI-like small molecule binding domain-containing protein n=1 Tax=Desulfovibrio litoralis DSM 11393 TaxID=1121455 RepID=A0A1M7SLY1_9BACT|nr:GyrI-like domain-containing protein [Desulfovibrio litoralis]SHN59472.1 hypothetical protein SAMN02745728_01014 [Desulfovibrio litoralis DSM 11393]
MKIVLGIIILLLIIIVCLYAYYGGFSAIVFRKEKQGGEVFVYQSVVGDYKLTGEITDAVYYYLLNTHNIETFKGAGIFYDDPRKVDAAKLRSESGCLLEDKTLTIDSLKLDKYSAKIIPEQNYIVTEMPYNGLISILLGIWRVYPALTKYLKENNLPENLPVMEIYDVPNKKIIYRVFIEQ